MSEITLESALTALAEKLSDEELEPILQELEQKQATISDLRLSVDALSSENRELTELVEMLNGSDKELRQAKWQKEQNAQEAAALKERETTLVSDQRKLSRDKAALASREEDYKERMAEYERINNDQEAELKSRLKSHKEAVTKKLEREYGKKEKALEKAYNDKNNRLWGVVVALSLANFIPLIGLIACVEENKADLGRFLLPIQNLSAAIASWTGGSSLVELVSIIALVFLVIALIAALCKVFIEKVDHHRNFFCVALAAFEVLLAVNMFLPPDYNPFWLGLIIFVVGMIGYMYHEKNK